MENIDVNKNKVIPKVVEVNDQLILQKIYELRVDIWKLAGIPPSNFKLLIWKDEHDDHAIHWAIIENNYPLAAARLCVHRKFWVTWCGFTSSKVS